MLMDLGEIGVVAAKGSIDDADLVAIHETGITTAFR
jgi:hypothetical protein